MGETIGNGLCIVNLRALSTQAKLDDDEVHRENIFYTRCMVEESIVVPSLIVEVVLK